MWWFGANSRAVLGRRWWTRPRRHSKSRSHLSNVRAASEFRQLVELAGSVMGVLAPIWIGMLKNPIYKVVQLDFSGPNILPRAATLPGVTNPALIPIRCKRVARVGADLL